MAIRNAELYLVGVSNSVLIIKANDALEIRDAFDLAIDKVRLNHVAEKERAVAVPKVARQRGRPRVQFKLSVAAHDIAAQDQTRRRINRVRVVGRAQARSRRHRPATEMDGNGKARMHVETLHDGRRDDWLAFNIAAEEVYVVNRLLAADAFEATFKGEINRETLEEAQR